MGKEASLLPASRGDIPFPRPRLVAGPAEVVVGFGREKLFRRTWAIQEDMGRPETWFKREQRSPDSREHEVLPEFSSWYTVLRKPPGQDLTSMTISFCWEQPLVVLLLPKLEHLTDPAQVTSHVLLQWVGREEVCSTSVACVTEASLYLHLQDPPMVGVTCMGSAFPHQQTSTAPRDDVERMK